MCRPGYRTHFAKLRLSPSAALLTYLLIASGPFQPAIAAEIQLRDGQSTENTQLVKVVLEVTGHLLTKEPDQTTEEAQKHPLKAIGNLVYEEKIQDLSSRKSLRFYEQASAEIEVDQRPETLTLRDDRRWIHASAEPDRPQGRRRGLPPCYRAFATGRPPAVASWSA